jgi:hypothetical protein
MTARCPEKWAESRKKEKVERKLGVNRKDGIKKDRGKNGSQRK